MNFESFQDWIVAVESRLIQDYGLTTLDCPNKDQLGQWYYNGVEPKGAVRRLLKAREEAMLLFDGLLL